MTPLNPLMILINHQRHLVTFGLVFQHMIIVQDHLTALLLLLHHLVRVHLVLMLPCSAQPTLQKILLLSIHIPFNIVPRGLDLVPLEMVRVATVPLRIAQSITYLHEEALQRQSHHRMFQEKKLEFVHFILMVEIRKLQRLESF